MIAVQRSHFSQSSDMSQCQLISTPSSSFQPDPDHDNDDDIQFWWDEHVSEFPAQFYSLLSPTDYQELFFDDDDYDYATDEYASDTDEYAYTMEQRDTMITTATCVKDVAKRKFTVIQKFSTVRMLNAYRKYRGPRISAATDHTTRIYDHQHITEESYANTPVIAFYNIDSPSLENLLMTSPSKERTLMTFLTMESKRKEKKRPSPNLSCELFREFRGHKENG